MKERNVEIDIMKGIAILCVMIGHASWSAGWLMTIIASFHMPLFFIISGYFSKTYQEGFIALRDLLRRNFQQLIIPYLIVTIVACAYTLLQSYHYGNYTPFKEIMLSRVLALDGSYSIIEEYKIGPAWFLLALFWGRLFFYWLSKCGKWLVPLSAVLSVFMIIVRPYVILPFCIGRGIAALIFMVVGWVYRNYKIPIWCLVIAILCWVVSMCLGEINIFSYRYNCIPIDLIGACGGTLVIYYVAKLVRRSFMEPFFLWCGRNSLIILCAHSIESSITVIHYCISKLPITMPSMVYYGVRHGVTLIGAWGYICMKDKIIRINK